MGHVTNLDPGTLAQGCMAESFSRTNLTGSEGEGPSTVDLLRLVQSGDSGAAEVLLARYRPRLLRWARGQVPRWTRGVMDTEDLVSQTLLAALPKLATFELRHQGALFAYLRRATRNHVVSLARSAEARLLSDGTVGSIADFRPSPVEELLGKERAERVERAFETLDEADQELIFAKNELALNWSEVAAITGRPSADAARVACKRALIKLVEVLADD